MLSMTPPSLGFASGTFRNISRTGSGRRPVNGSNMIRPGFSPCCPSRFVTYHSYALSGSGTAR